MIVADVLRLADIAMALVLVPLCAYCIVYSRTWDQRLRFATLAGYAIVTVGGQINALGAPLTWVTVLLAMVTVAAVVGTSAYMIQVRDVPA